MLVTALATPFGADGAPDLGLVTRLVAFQLDQGVDAVLLGGTTGEGVLLDEREQTSLIDAALEAAPADRLMVSIGGGRLDEVIARGRRALDRGVRELLLADCAYIGPSSAALCDAWHAPIAEALPDACLVPYAIPGRTGAELLPDDLARLAERCANVVAVKDATGRLARMGRVRELCGTRLKILCGDDPLLRDALVDPDVRADGACSVISNIAPLAVRALVDSAGGGDLARARTLHELLSPLFGIVSVTVDELQVVGGRRVAVPCRSKNPVPLKTALAILEVMRPDVRAPLSGVGVQGYAAVHGALREVAIRRREVFEPIADAFGCDLDARLGLSADVARESV